MECRDDIYGSVAVCSRRSCICNMYRTEGFIAAVGFGCASGGGLSFLKNYLNCTAGF